MDLNNKVILITGSSKGIGRETAFAFAREKSVIIITYNSDKKGALETERKCLSLGASGTLVLNLDVTDDKSIKSAAKKAVSKCKKIDFLINNSGVISWDDFEKQDFKIIQSQIRTNLEGLIKMTFACIRNVKEGIINIASKAGKEADSDLVVYRATKFGVRGFTHSLAIAYPKLLIASVNPSMTATNMTGFRGVHPSKVAKVILNLAKGKIKPDSEKDVDVWKYF